MSKTATSGSLAGLSIFLSASIPDPARWTGTFDALAITDAVVAMTRAILRRDGRLVTAAHPTIAPLMLYVAAESESRVDNPIIIYQSAAFDSILPESTRQFEAIGAGSIIRTAAVAGEPPDPALAPQSLQLMRQQMLTEQSPAGAVFIGGMNGITAEYDMFREIRGQAPTYAFGRPGGAAKTLTDESPKDLIPELASSAIYPTVARLVLDDLIRRARS